ncbi:MAG TPA: aldehyde dehydrogenase (NADP(+)) [Chitinophagaceae bacterium]|nr:aldehyde dehydrogenase (NADP(+)) [Chitinophagaceae bacterium]
MYPDATREEINQVMEQAWKAFLSYRNSSPKQRAGFMRGLASALEEREEQLISAAGRETNLLPSRLKNELARTVFQLRFYAEACEKGLALDARIDTGKLDLRKMNVPLGPVVVFGASNFPFAYSTAGGDTACAFAAGCPVIVKAHPAHAETSELVAGAINDTIAALSLPNGIFSHVHGTAYEVGEALVKHPRTRAVGFTGSQAGGKQLFEWGNQRRDPIPVFAEMGSVNPIFLFPEKLKQSGTDIAKSCAASITLGVGQFCTNPGLIIGLESDALQEFIRALAEEIRTCEPGTMLHTGIFKSYVEKRANALAQEHVEMVAAAEAEPQFNQATPTIATATGTAFLNNPILHQEVFGPYSIVIRCRDETEMMQVARELEGQLTATLMATEADLKYHEELVEEVKNLCGRFILNGVPTGVDVRWSMHHGGPFPATTDSRFTSVGPDGIRRFARPLCFQNWPNHLLPVELRDENPLGIWRMVNNQWTK